MNVVTFANSGSDAVTFASMWFWSICPAGVVWVTKLIVGLLRADIDAFAVALMLLL